MTSRTKMALSHFENGRYRECFAIVSTFRLGINKEDVRTVQIARDCLNGRGGFYSQIGIDEFATIENAKEIVKKLYYNNKKQQ